MKSETRVRAATPPRAAASRPGTLAKRERIVQAALRHFADRGFHEARIEDLARELGIAKGSIFQHFGSKAGLFLETYRSAVRTFPAYLDAPEAVLDKGFFETLRYWLIRTEHLVREDYIPYRVSLLGNYGTDLRIRREINRFLVSEDPYGTAAFVKMGVERGEVREDLDRAMVVSILDWTMERFQDALLTEELDPGLFHRPGQTLEKKEERVRQFLEVLRGAVGKPQAQKPKARRSRSREGC
ncbi:MAG: TetR/AcrR family transcriptional regulator [Terriglobia bacterium]